MSRKKVELIITLKDKVSSTLSRIGRGIGSLTRNIFNMKNLFRGLALASPFLALGKAIKTAFNFETARFQLKAVLGTMAEANSRFRELKNFSAKTPFQLPDILRASRLLSVFSNGVLGGAESLEFLGNAAAVANRNIDEVAFWVARAYSLIQNGQPFGEAALRLQEMGVMTPKARQEIDLLTKSGAAADKVWGVLRSDLGRFTGAMQEMSQTGNGLISTLKDNWTIAVATFGDEFTKLAKGGIKEAITKIRELVSDGTITKWAASAKEALVAVAQAAKILVSGGEGRAAVLKAMGGLIKAAFVDAATSMIALLLKYAPVVGDAIGSAAKTAFKSIGQDHATQAQIDYAKSQAYNSKTPVKEQRAAYSDLIDKFKEINKTKRLQREGAEAVKAVDTAGSRTKVALELLASAIDTYSDDVEESTRMAVAASNTIQQYGVGGDSMGQGGGGGGDSGGGGGGSSGGGSSGGQSGGSGGGGGQTSTSSASNNIDVASNTLTVMEASLASLKSGEFSYGGKSDSDARKNQALAVSTLQDKITSFKKSAISGDIFGVAKGTNLDTVSSGESTSEKTRNSYLKTISENVGGVK